MTVQGGRFPPSWNTPAPRSSGYSSSIHADLAHYQPEVPGPSHDPFPHQPADGNFLMVPDNYLHHPSSSSISRQTVPSVDDSFYNQTIGSSRGPYKRKSPGIPPLCDRGSTSRYYDVGSSSNMHLRADPWQEKQNTESYRTPWEYPPGYRVNSLSISGECMPRNVRSRPGVDLEPNPARAHLSSNSLHQSFSSRSSDQSNSVDFWRWSSNTPTTEWNHCPDSSFFSHDPNTLNALNSHGNGFVDSGGYSHNNATSNRNYIPQNANCNVNQPIRGIRSGYDQRSVPAFRTSSSNFHAEQIAASDEGLQMAAESYPPRHPRAFPTIRLRNSERNGRTGISSDRYRSFTEEARSYLILWRLSCRAFFSITGIIMIPSLLSGLMAVDRYAFYGSRTPFDHHGDMRLDVDNMSYEELLELGERIGSVNTGLSDSLISKCLTESIFCSSDQFEDDGRCVICLEEYKNMDDVGTLKCGHDFHVGCIRKWLSMKNLCPICKTSAMDESKKEKRC
ncbi:hypothetical protein DH2020_040068 [Rehmannia glutinosa]|uniref:RING-type E3 ubiquitin transferase n=1 Tax=Rehmannia glutinosa TaxID=99300 RepID=A0ABR0UV65_REHGL